MPSVQASLSICRNQIVYCKCSKQDCSLRSCLPISNRMLRRSETEVIIQLRETINEIEEPASPAKHSSTPTKQQQLKSPGQIGWKRGFLNKKGAPAASFAAASTDCPNTPASPAPSQQSLSSTWRPASSKSPDRSNAHGEKVASAQLTVLEPAPVEEIREVVELPPPVKCRVCSTDIQPTTEVYYSWKCCDQCDFCLHKECLHSEMAKQQFKKKREYKDATCVTEGCSAMISSVHEFDMKNKKTLYIKSENERLEKQDRKKFDKLKFDLVKDQKRMKKEPIPYSTRKVKIEKNDNFDHDSGNASSRPSATPEEQNEPEVIPEPKMVLPSKQQFISLAMPNAVTEKPILNPLMIRVSQKAVPLMKKADEVESKYAVSQLKTVVKQKTKKKKEIIDVFAPRTAAVRTGGFEDYPLPSPDSFMNSRVPESWEDDRYSDSHPSTITLESQFTGSDSVPYIHEPSQFPGNINGVATFPLPGTPQCKEYINHIIDLISGRLEDLVVNTAVHVEGANWPLYDLLDAILLVTGDILEDSHTKFLRKLFEGEDLGSLRDFMTGLKYFMIARSMKGLSFCKNQKGRMLHSKLMGNLASEPIAIVTHQEDVSPAVSPQISRDVVLPPIVEYTVSTTHSEQTSEHAGMSENNESFHSCEQNEFINNDYDDNYRNHPLQEDLDKNFTHKEEPFFFAGPPRILKRSEGDKTSRSVSSELVDQVMNFALSASKEERDRVYVDDVDKKISLKVATLNLKAQIMKEERQRRSSINDDWQEFNSDYPHAPHNDVLHGFHPPGIPAHSRPATGPGIFSQRSHRQESQLPESARKVVSLEQVNNMEEDYKRKAREMEEQMKEQAELIKRIEEELAETINKYKALVLSHAALSNVVTDKDNRIREEVELREQEVACVMQLELKKRQLDVERDHHYIQSSLYHNKSIILSLMKCQGPEFDEMVSELSDNHRKWEEMEKVVIDRKRLINDGHTTDLPVLPEVPVMSDNATHFFTMAVEHSSYFIMDTFKEHFAKIKSELVYIAELSDKDLPPREELKAMVLKEMQAQNSRDFDPKLVVRRISAELNLSPIESTVEPATRSTITSFGDRYSSRKSLSPAPFNSAWGTSTSISDRRVDMQEILCEICLETMTNKQELHYCEHCREPYHKTCVLVWLERQASCPHCRSNMPHPGHYPELR